MRRTPTIVFSFVLTAAVLAATALTLRGLRSPRPQVRVIAEGLLAPIGLAVLPDGTLLVAEEGTGADDTSAGVSFVTRDGRIGRLVSGLPSNRDSGDLAGVPLVAVSPVGNQIYFGNFGAGHLWTVPLPLAGSQMPSSPLSLAQLGTTMHPLNNVFLVNPFDLTFDAQGVPVVTDASGNGVAKETPDGATRFIHRFPELPNPVNPGRPIEAVPTGITRVGAEYYVALTGGCPFPEGGGQIVAIDENRNQRTVVDGLTMPIDVAQGPDGTIWILEFAHFDPEGSCFDGMGYEPESGRLSRLGSDGRLVTVLDSLNYPGAVLPMPDGSLYVSEVFPGRILHVSFTPLDDGPAPDSVSPQVAALVEDQEAQEHTTVIGGEARLQNVASGVGLSFQHGAFRTGIFEDPVAMMGGGLCWLDFDNDGWLDLYLVNSYADAESDYWQGEGAMPRNALYRNNKGRFLDVSQASRADLTMRGNGCVAADFNGDGWWDLYITADGPNALLWNNGDGTFREGAVAAGVAAPEWNTAATVGDLNGDQLPDLFVAAYIDLQKKIPKPIGAFPQDFLGLPDRLYLNNGLSADGAATFLEVSTTAGLVREERGLGALLSDLDGDNDLDLYIANDGHPNRLYENRPWPDDSHPDPQGLGFRFIDLTETANVGDSGSGMGVAGGDYDGDGLTDLFVTNWERELNALYQNESGEEGHLTFQYSTYRIGISGLGNNMTGWGTAWLDLDQDTDLDLLVVNGRVPITDLAFDAQLVRLYRNRGWSLEQGLGRPGQFIEWTQQAGLADVGPLLARGSAVADYDNDGDLDVAINTIGGPVVLLQNDGTHGHWMQVSFSGFCPGAQATLTLPDSRRLVRSLHVGSSYLASEDPRLHFGLGAFTRVPELRVVLPDNRSLTFNDLAADQVLPVNCQMRAAAGS